MMRSWTLLPDIDPRTARPRVRPGASVCDAEPDVENGAGTDDAPFLGLEIDEIETVGPIGRDLYVRIEVGFEMGQRGGRRFGVRIRDDEPGERRPAGHPVCGQGAKIRPPSDRMSPSPKVK